MAKKIPKEEEQTEEHNEEETQELSLEEYVAYLEQRVQQLEGQVSLLLRHNHTTDGTVVVPLSQ